MAQKEELEGGRKMQIMWGSGNPVACDFSLSGRQVCLVQNCMLVWLERDMSDVNMIVGNLGDRKKVELQTVIVTAACACTCASCLVKQKRFCFQR